MLILTSMNTVLFPTGFSSCQKILPAHFPQISDPELCSVVAFSLLKDAYKEGGFIILCLHSV